MKKRIRIAATGTVGSLVSKTDFLPSPLSLSTRMQTLSLPRFFLIAWLAITVSLTSAFIPAAKPDAGRKKLEALSGTYADPKPYAYGTAWGHRTFTFDKGAWTLVFTLSLDPAQKMKVFQFRTLGTYQVGARSRAVGGAYEAVFTENRKFLTLKTDDPKLAAAFGFGDCGLTPQQERDISESGCAAWKPVRLCPADHDLLALDARGGLSFGERPRDNDMCTPDKRPTKLTPPVVKQ